jgi:hypothetical protein
MDANKGSAEAKVQPIAAPGRSTFISDELNRITEIVTAICPRDAEVTFTFEDGRLELNIDIRQLEDLVRIEGQLPGMCGGIFSDVQRGLVDNRPFFHRLTARVDR